MTPGRAPQSHLRRSGGAQDRREISARDLPQRKFSALPGTSASTYLDFGAGRVRASSLARPVQARTRTPSSETLTGPAWNARQVRGVDMRDARAQSRGASDRRGQARTRQFASMSRGRKAQSSGPPPLTGGLPRAFADLFA